MAAPMNVSDQTVTRGNNNIPVLRYRLNSNSQDIALSALRLTASGSGNDQTAITSVKVWLDTNANGTVDTGELQIGEGQFDADNGSLDLSLSAPLPLPMGDTDVLVTYDF